MPVQAAHLGTLLGGALTRRAVAGIGFRDGCGRPLRPARAGPARRLGRLGLAPQRQSIDAGSARLVGVALQPRCQLLVLRAVLCRVHVALEQDTAEQDSVLEALCLAVRRLPFPGFLEREDAPIALDRFGVEDSQANGLCCGRRRRIAFERECRRTDRPQRDRESEAHEAASLSHAPRERGRDSAAPLFTHGFWCSQITRARQAGRGPDQRLAGSRSSRPLISSRSRHASRLSAGWRSRKAG